MCESQGRSHIALGLCVDPTVLLRVVTNRTYILVLGIKPPLSNTQPFTFLCRLKLLN